LRVDASGAEMKINANSKRHIAIAWEISSDIDSNNASVNAKLHGECILEPKARNKMKD
jgi:hypothetical protein